ncbi:MAG: UDP-N-acetylglucosamine 1-carboxyvinyltransferase [Candidatus Berkelbacteria bacterium]|nr:UDP-N-acetylglucosamine 1-carboxyvinyltransferase [Candidatus Berkelbacteria bacterium]
MAKFIVTGGQKLEGDFVVAGAKNAALKMIAASIMIPGRTTIYNVPRIIDVLKMIEIIESLGGKSQFVGNTLTVDASEINSSQPNNNAIQQLRGSVVIIGPLLSLFGKAEFAQPGGCLIGARPIDTHLNAFKSMGAEIKYSGEHFQIATDDDFKTGDKVVVLEEMSVTATENVMMASVLRSGKTRIEICAAEPEIADLAEFLNKAGAKISGAGTNTIVVDGVEKLQPIEYAVMPDRIEVGTIAIAAAITGGKVRIKNIIPAHLQIVLNKFRACHLDFEIEMIDEKFADMIINQKTKLQAPETKWVDTRPYPGFPTDLQPPFVVLMTQAAGRTKVFETIFESRFDYVKWLSVMGAKIEIESPHIVEIEGKTKLHGEMIESTDLRGGAALILAALCADGETVINNTNYVDRGYENFDERLKKLGAKIERVE